MKTILQLIRQLIRPTSMRIVLQIITSMFLFFVMGEAFSFAQENKELPILSNTDKIVFCNAMGEEQTLQGTVLNITGAQGLIFLPQNEKKPLFIVPEMILQLETVLTVSHRQGQEAFQEAKRTGDMELWRKAHSCFLQARKSEEKRPWIRFWLTSLLVQTNLALQKKAAAAQEFLLLCQVEDYTPWLVFIPLTWDIPTTMGGASTENIALEQIVLPWLEPQHNPTGKPNHAARLLAASVLLDGSINWQKKAVEALQELIVLKSPDPQSPVLNQHCEIISLLAFAQLERKKIFMPHAESNITTLEQTVLRLPVPLKMGPFYLLGKYWIKNQKPEKALEYFLRIPLLYPENSELAEMALNQANALLKRLGREAEAKQLIGH